MFWLYCCSSTKKLVSIFLYLTLWKVENEFFAMVIKLLFENVIDKYCDTIYNKIANFI